MINLPLRIFTGCCILIFSIGFLVYCTSSSERKIPAGGKANGDNDRRPESVTSEIRKGIPATDTVSITDMNFHPENITVHKGDTVIWINHDIVTHCVTESGNKEWTSSAISPGASWRMVVTKSSDYYCAIHPVMKGRIEIKGF